MDLIRESHVVGIVYIKSLQGICKIVQIVASFIGALLVGINFPVPAISVFESAAAVSIISAIFFLIIYIADFVKVTTLPWNRIQLFFHFMLTVYYIAAVVLVLEHHKVPQMLAGGVFGFVAIVAHFMDGYENYRRRPLC